MQPFCQFKAKNIGWFSSEILGERVSIRGNGQMGIQLGIKFPKVKKEECSRIPKLEMMGYFLWVMKHSSMNSEILQ